MEHEVSIQCFDGDGVDHPPPEWSFWWDETLVDKTPLGMLNTRLVAEWTKGEGKFWEIRYNPHQLTYDLKQVGIRDLTHRLFKQFAMEDDLPIRHEEYLTLVDELKAFIAGCGEVP